MKKCEKEQFLAGNSADCNTRSGENTVHPVKG
jgi:hypothetical protein